MAKIEQRRVRTPFWDKYHEEYIIERWTNDGWEIEKIEEDPITVLDENEKEFTAIDKIYHFKREVEE